MQKLMAINDAFDATAPVIVYGTGRMALLTHTLLLEEGVSVYAFCGKDTDLTIMNKPIISEEQLTELASTATVVFAGENLLEAESVMGKLGVDAYFVDDRTYSIVNDCVWSFM